METVTERISFSDLEDYIVLQTELQGWMEAVLEEKFTMMFEEALQDGVMLCRLINYIKPDSVPLSKVHFGDNLPLPYKLENISFFLEAAKKLDVHASKFFEASSLVAPRDSKDMQKVAMTLYWIAKAVHSSPSYSGPRISSKFFEERKCSICKKPICLGQNVRATSTEQWHASCVCCSVCWKVDEPSQIMISDGKLFCTKCVLDELGSSAGTISLAGSGVLEIQADIANEALQNLGQIGFAQSVKLGEPPAVPDVDFRGSMGIRRDDAIVPVNENGANDADDTDTDSADADGADEAVAEHVARKAPLQRIQSEVVMVMSPTVEHPLGSVIGTPQPVHAPAGILPTREATMSGGVLYVPSPTADRHAKGDHTPDHEHLLSSVIQQAGIDREVADKYAKILVAEEVLSLDSLLGINDRTLKVLGLSYGHIGLIRSKYVYMDQNNQNHATQRTGSAPVVTRVQNKVLFSSLSVHTHKVLSVAGQIQLKAMYDNHEGVFADDQQTYDYYFEFANDGDAVAQTVVGWMYADGRGIVKDKKKSVEWFQKAATQGFAIAQNSLAVRYKWGEGTAQDYKKAYDFFTLAGKQGLPSAQYNTAVCFETGKGTKQDLEKAFKWYKRAADNGVVNALAKIGMFYAHGKGVKEDMVKAVEYYILAGDKGNSEAQNNLGFCYDKAKGVEKDERQAAYWYTKAAEQNCACAQNNIANMYLKGRGVEKNVEKALYWYERAADNGDADAQYNLGEIYESGDGVAHSKIKSDDWYQKAVISYRKDAHKGDCHAQTMLGSMYHKGKGVEVNRKKAKKWFTKALISSGKMVPPTEAPAPAPAPQPAPAPAPQQPLPEPVPEQKVKVKKAPKARACLPMF